MNSAMSRQASSAILQIMAEVDRIDANAHTKHSLKRFINDACLAAGITVVDRKERVQFARRLLDDGEPRPVIRDRLMARFRISRTSAYNAIESALHSSRKLEKFWTNGAQNGFTDLTNPTQDNEGRTE
jgi:hypothetical protein